MGSEESIALATLTEQVKTLSGDVSKIITSQVEQSNKINRIDKWILKQEVIADEARKAKVLDAAKISKRTNIWAVFWAAIAAVTTVIALFK